MKVLKPENPSRAQRRVPRRVKQIYKFKNISDKSVSYLFENRPLCKYPHT